MLKDTYLHYYNRYLNLLGYDINTIKESSVHHFIQISQAIETIRKHLHILDTFDIDYDDVFLINELRNEHIFLTNVQDYDVDFLNYKYKLQYEKYKYSETDLQ